MKMIKKQRLIVRWQWRKWKWHNSTRLLVDPNLRKSQIIFNFPWKHFSSSKSYEDSRNCNSAHLCWIVVGLYASVSRKWWWGKNKKSKHSGVHEIEIKMEMLSAANDHSALNYCCTNANQWTHDSDVPQ